MTRYVYDGALAQEHLFDVLGNGSWAYGYLRLTHDCLRQPAGIRDRVHPAQGADTDGPTKEMSVQSGVCYNPPAC